MGLGLYDAAFGTLGRIYGSDARSSITGLTLIAGFASTVGWPLSSLGLETIGWRETCFAWAVAHIVLGLPLNLIVPIPQTRHLWYSMDLLGTALLYRGPKNKRKTAKMGPDQYSRKSTKVTEKNNKTSKISSFIFSVAPMMDWTN